MPRKTKCNRRMKKAGSKSCRRMRKMRGGFDWSSLNPLSYIPSQKNDAANANAPVAPVAAGVNAANANAAGANTMLGGKKCKSRKCKK